VLNNHAMRHRRLGQDRAETTASTPSVGRRCGCAGEHLDQSRGGGRIVTEPYLATATCTRSLVTSSMAQL
jgi:hypothetical protein